MPTDNPSLTAGTLVDGARMYAAAADAVNERLPNALHVLSHLLGMSIELSLKAYLRHGGLSERELRNLGHDLGALLTAAEQRGFESTGSRHFRITILGANYDERLFAYPQEGQLNVILPARLREVAHELIEEVFIVVHGKVLYAQLHREPGLCIQSAYPGDLDPAGWAQRP